MGLVIAVLSPMIGFPSALQVAGLFIAVLGGGGGILCLHIAARDVPESHSGADHFFG